MNSASDKCLLCLDRLPTTADEAIIFHCTQKHSFCRECAKDYFKKKICGHSIDFSCPICKTPDLLKDTMESSNYISWLKNCLDGLLSDKLFGQFEELLDDRNLIINPNYARCPNCQNVFAKSASNPKCLKCEHTSQKNNDTTELSEQLETLRWSSDIVFFKCKQCKNVAYVEPSTASCLHMSCEICSYECCRGCDQPIHHKKCEKANCKYSKLHCHCPRFCASYMRDFSVAELTGLLQTSGVTVPQPKAVVFQAAKCSRINMDYDPPCPCQAPISYAAYECCTKHSQLVLAELIRQHRIDPLPILDAKFCMQELRRLGVPLPERGPYDDDPKYKEKCAQVLRMYPLSFD